MVPEAVLLDAGGVFVLPDPRRIVAAFARAECPVDPDVVADAHYRAAARFGTHLDVEADWGACWSGYVDSYVEACGVPADAHAEAHRHVAPEFADAALWIEPIAGSGEGLRVLAATGVRLGIVSNADGLMAQRLATLDVCQVGPGAAVEVACVIDSGAVGVMKPDAAIFEIALAAMGVAAEDAVYLGDMPAIDVVGARRAGLRPVVIDPLGLHLDADYDRTGSLAELAATIRAAA